MENAIVQSQTKRMEHACLFDVALNDYVSFLNVAARKKGVNRSLIRPYSGSLRQWRALA